MKSTGIIPIHNVKNPGKDIDLKIKNFNCKIILGPGAYQALSTLSKTSYSFRKRTPIDDPILSQIKPVPGPGA